MITLLILSQRAEPTLKPNRESGQDNQKQIVTMSCALCIAVCDVIAAGATWQANKRAGQSRAQPQHSTARQEFWLISADCKPEARQKGGRLTTTTTTTTIPSGIRQ